MKIFKFAFVLMISVGCYSAAFADHYSYIQWVTPPTVGYSSIGYVYFAETDGTPKYASVSYTGEFVFGADSQGASYFPDTGAYVSPTVQNRPLTGDLVGIVGGEGTTHRIAFSYGSSKLALALVSVGSWGIPITYEFDRPFTIVSQGLGVFGDGPLSQISPTILQGEEGHGTLHFAGFTDELNWTVPLGEFWHGFNFGVSVGNFKIVHLRANMLDFVGFENQYAYDRLVHVTLRNVDTLVEETTFGSVDRTGNVTTFTRLPNGTYDATVKGIHWLKKTLPASLVLTEEGGVVSGVFDQINGDVDDDNEVTLVDFGILASAFGAAVGDPQFLVGADLDGDEEVTLVDLGILSSSFGLAGDE